jgi:peptide/nickel transport system permease protein
MKLPNLLKELLHYRSAVLGMTIIGALIALALYTIIAIPYDEAIREWRGGEEIWGDYPRNAAPEWFSIFSNKKIPTTILIDSKDKRNFQKQAAKVTDDMRTADILMTFDYQFDEFPTEINLFMTGNFQSKKPQATISWKTPDGRQISLGDTTVGPAERYTISIDQRLIRRLDGFSPEIGLFADPATMTKGPKESTPVPLKGKYELKVEGLTFEKDSDLDAKLVVYGQAYGWGGTDHHRRDLMVALLWGTPIALAFGFLAAVGQTLITFAIAALGAWFGGRLDGAIQRLTEINSVLPTLTILIMVGYFYTRNIWVILGVVIVLGIFNLSIKLYRSMFLQVKEMPYIEAAHAYGASNLRIVFQYMMPKIAPVLVPTFVTLIPSFVFLEASLAVLGLGDPVLPTWGKVINDAYTNGALYKGYYYWVIEPAVLLMFTGLGFAVVGFALDRIANPRLREM